MALMSVTVIVFVVDWEGKHLRNMTTSYDSMLVTLSVFFLQKKKKKRIQDWRFQKYLDLFLSVYL